MRKQLELRFKKKPQSQIKNIMTLIKKVFFHINQEFEFFYRSGTSGPKKLNKKLNSKFLNPFRIIKAIGRQTYRLKFSPGYSRFYNVFYISLLESYYNRKDRISVTSEFIFIEKQDEWAVEQILVIKKN
jgi:hypothetical protein